MKTNQDIRLLRDDPDFSVLITNIDENVAKVGDAVDEITDLSRTIRVAVVTSCIVICISTLCSLTFIAATILGFIH